MFVGKLWGMLGFKYLHHKDTHSKIYFWTINKSLVSVKKSFGIVLDRKLNFNFILHLFVKKHSKNLVLF